MNWVSLAFFSVIFYSLFDLFLKLSSDKLHNSLNGVIVNAVATLVLVVFLIYAKLQGENVFAMKAGGLLYSILAGVVVGIATIFFVKMFASGTNLSVGVPFVRVGIVVVAGIIGVVFLHEGINAKYIVGTLLSLVGLVFLISA